MAKFGDGRSVPNQGGHAEAPTKGTVPDSGMPGGTPTGSTPMKNNGSWKGKYVPGHGGSGKNISGPKSFK